MKMDRFEKPLPLLSESPNTPVNKLVQEYISAWASTDGMIPLARSRDVAELHFNTATTSTDKAKACVDLAVIDLSQASVYERWESQHSRTPGPFDESQIFQSEAKELLKKATKLDSAVAGDLLIRSLQGK
jgi:hypothetical protein